MSFLTDLFEGNFDNLGTDISHAPSSLAAHPDEIAELAGGAALVAAPFLLPEIGAALGVGGLAEGAIDVGGAALASEGGLAADLGIADIGAAAEGATGATLAGESAPFLAADTLDFGGALGAAGEFGSLEAGTGGEFGSMLPESSSLASLSSDASGFNIPGETFVQPGDVVTPAGATVSDVPAGAGAAPSADLNVTQAADPWAGIRGVNDMTGVAAAKDTGITGMLGDALSSPWTKLAAGVAPLALTLGMGQQQLPAGAQALQNQALQMQQSGLTDLSNARQGILNQGQTAQLAKLRQDSTNRWRQTLFNQGVQDPSKDARWPYIADAIDQEVTVATGQMIQQNITNALAETGQAAQALTAIAQMQMKADSDFTNALIGATKSLGLAAGLSSVPKISIG